MKKWFIILGIIGFLSIGIYLVLSYYATKMIQTQVHKMIGPGLTIEQIKVNIASLSLKGIHFEEPEGRHNLFKIEEVRIYPALLSFLKNGLRLRACTVLKPSFFFYRTREGDWIGPWLQTPKEDPKEESSRSIDQRGKKSFPVRIDHLRVEKGSLNFHDMKVEGSPEPIRLEELELTLNQIAYPPVSSQSPIEFKGKMMGGLKPGRVTGNGWIDFGTSDLEILLKTEGIDLKRFEPYYRKRVSAEIQSGEINMVAHISMKRKIIDTPVTLEMVDLFIGEKGTIFYLPVQMLLPRLKAQKNRLKTQFRVIGDLNDPRFKLEEVFVTKVGLGLAESAGLPVKRIGEDLLEGLGRDGTGK